MSDFETHEIGTAKEIELSRKLYDELYSYILTEQSIPPSLKQAHENLRNHYLWQTRIFDQL